MQQRKPRRNTLKRSPDISAARRVPGRQPWVAMALRQRRREICVPRGLEHHNEALGITVDSCVLEDYERLAGSGRAADPI